jgi:hypothetical protein
MTGHTSKHMEDRAVKAMKATVEIKKLNLRYIATARKLFILKVAPIATYGIELIWNHLTYSNLKRQEGVRIA